jgi:hypothetical protein
MISVARCQELAGHYKTLSQMKGISPERAFLLKNIAKSFTGATGQLDRLAALVREEEKSPRLASSNSGKQVNAGRREPREGVALVQDQPAEFDRQLHAGTVFGG